MSLINSLRTLVVSTLLIIFYQEVKADIAAPYGGAYANAGFSAGYNAQAAYGLQGSGYWGGTQSCPYRTRIAKNAVDVTDEEKAEKEKIKKLKVTLATEKTKQKRAETEIDYLQKKLERFFDTEIADFIISTHIEKMNKCENYRTFPDLNCPKVGTTVTAQAADSSGAAAPSAELIAKCNGLDTVPDKLKDKWTLPAGGGYCSANSDSSKGLVNSSICGDATLRPTDAPKYRSYSVTECSKALTDYRKRKIELDNAQNKIERAEEEIRDREYNVSDIRERAKIEKEAKKSQTESDCEECDLEGRTAKYQRPQRDWLSTAANVVGGLGLIYYGKKVDESAQEYNAQLGFPSNNSYGYPYVTAGFAGVINGVAGPGAYGCGGGYGGAGFPYGAGGANSPYGLNGYGPNAALGGAFGYPGNMYGNPWGGGAYNPGVGLNGAFNGPNLGWPFGGGANGQIGLGFPNNNGGYANGNLGGNGALCFTWPCPAANGGGYANGQLGLGFPNNGGYLNGNGGGYLNGGLGSYVNNPQYQMQLMQQQQMMLQQQMQQQQMMAQYYQAQAQAQMQAYQRQQQVAQQTSQITQEIYSLQMRLQMLNSGVYSGASNYSGNIYGGGSLGTGIGGGGFINGSVYFGAAAPSPTYYNTGYSTGYNTGYGTGTLNTGYGTLNNGTATVPGMGTTGRGR